MYRGFNLELKEDYSEYLAIGNNLYKDASIRVKNTLSRFKNSDGSIDGSKLRANWFPVEKIDIFISHSHKDKVKAIALAGLLNKKFNLTSFIDSCVWGFADDLLWLIDTNYCKRNSELYAYEKRNHSTAHVHMMLTTALASMMDISECLFFLNTPRTITPNIDIEKTESPWIYCEISMSRILQKKKPNRIITESRIYSDINEDEKLNIQYDVPLDHLSLLNDSMLNQWIQDQKSNSKGQHSLDLLYDRIKK